MMMLRACKFVWALEVCIEYGTVVIVKVLKFSLGRNCFPRPKATVLFGYANSLPAQSCKA